MEEFSFPTVVADRAASATALWFHSPEADTPGHLRRSFSEGGAHIATTCRRALWRPGSPAALSDCGGGELDEYEERMDMLWEDFNEELIFRAPLGRGKDEEGEEGEGEGEGKSARRRRSVGMDALFADVERGNLVASKQQAAVELRLVQAALEVSKSGPLRRRKPGLVVMLRMLKKLFVVQKTRASKRTAKVEQSSEI